MALKLCKGVALIIDDKAFQKKGEEDDPIIKIISKIKGVGIPYCAYTSLKEAELALENLHSINFLILDWDLLGRLDVDEPDVILRPAQSNKVIQFIKAFRSKCFCPIFIFSNANIADIKDKLESAELYFKDKHNSIIVQAKKDLLHGNKLFTAINKWIENNPVLYTLKHWENAFLLAKNETFWNLYSKSSSWPQILWDTFDEDSVNPQANLNDIIYRLVKSRTTIFNLDPRKIKRKAKLNLEEIKDVIQGTMYLLKGKFPEEEFMPGDVFKYGGNYYINIRPECDTVVARTSFDGKLYLLKGSKLSSVQFKKNHYNKKYGIIHQNNNVLVYGLDSKDFVRFNLKQLEIKELADIKEHRICRLLPPFINDIQQQYSAYTGRLGVPRIPNKVLKSI